MRDARLGLLLVLASAAAYGAMPILAKVAYGGGVRPATLLAWRFVLATTLFALLDRRAENPPLGRRLVLWGLGGVFVCNAFAYFGALETVPASTVALLLYTYPVLVALFSAVAGLDPLTPRGLAAALAVFAGAALTAGPAWAGASASGAALALLAAVLYAGYIVLGSRFAADVASETAARHVSQACVAAYVSWAALRGELFVEAAPRAWLAVAAIAVLCTVFALRAFLAGLARVGPSRAAVASGAEVLVTILLATAFLGESIGPRQWVGAGLILGGVAFHSLGRHRRAA